MSDWSIQEIPAGQLRIDPDVQRGLTTRRVSREADRLNLDGLGIITVSKRGPDDLVIVDGQHRNAFVLAVKGPEHPMLCKVFTGLSKQQEASLFLVLNRTVQVRYLEQFHVRITEDDPVANYLAKVLKKHGWPIGPGPSHTHFNAVKALEDVYNLDPSVDPTPAARAVATAAGAWKHTKGAMNGQIVRALGMIYAKYRRSVDDGAMIDKLAKYEGGPDALLGAARGLRTFKKISIADALAELVVDAYNIRRKNSALPAWRSRPERVTKSD